MNGIFQMQGGKNWILPKEINANWFFWDSHWLEIWSNQLSPSMGGIVAMDSGGVPPKHQFLHGRDAGEERGLARPASDQLYRLHSQGEVQQVGEYEGVHHGRRAEDILEQLLFSCANIHEEEYDIQDEGRHLCT
jgi:hypothetical protein